MKILGNVAFNPISALTGATLVRMVRDPDVNAAVRDIMAETESVGKKLGLELPISIDQRIAGAEKVGEHKTSMLQDLEAGRPLELEAVVGAVLEIGERLDIPMPATRAVYAATKLMAARRSERLSEESLGATGRVGDRDGDDRQPAICLDLICGADSCRPRMEALRHPGRHSRCFWCARRGLCHAC